MYVTQYHYKTVPQNSYFAGLMIVLIYWIGYYGQYFHGDPQRREGLNRY